MRGPIAVGTEQLITLSHNGLRRFSRAGEVVVPVGRALAPANREVVPFSFGNGVRSDSFIYEGGKVARFSSNTYLEEEMVAEVTLALSLMVAGSPTVEAPAVAPNPTELAEQAYAMFRSPAAWARAGDLLLSAARAEGGTSLEAVEWTLHAGHALLAAGKTERARDAFRLAGERGVEVGAVMLAADAYLNAATLTLRFGERQEADDLMQKAERLASSPHLSAPHREAILRRLGR